MNPAHKRVLDAIEYRREAFPVSLDVLSTMTGMDERTVKQIIQDLRRDHHQPIGHSRKAGQSGYYMIRCPKELRAMIQRLRYEANSRHITANKMEKALTMQAELF
ncbi:hypothetical protein LCGC14_2620230 [marine sediment metagenome]|uniref:Helix-turn-helix type 11 domain-containing protein n=1 Tax=marine sediment metagenome TaxID=412755 RepID=A0A0F9A3I2_9ZZZZ